MKLYFCVCVFLSHTLSFLYITNILRFPRSPKLFQFSFSFTPSRDLRELRRSRRTHRGGGRGKNGGRSSCCHEPLEDTTLKKINFGIFGATRILRDLILPPRRSSLLARDPYRTRSSPALPRSSDVLPLVGVRFVVSMVSLSYIETGFLSLLM